VSVPGITFRALDGAQAAAAEDDLLALTAQQHPGADAGYQRRLRVWRRQPGFVLAEARHGGYLVGYAAGMPLRPSTSWWKELTAPLPDEVTAEHPGRTFALTALIVRAAWRRQGIGAGLHRLILAGRPEERAAITVSPAATAAQRALRTWGWAKVARTRVPGEGESVRDVLLLFLPLAAAPGNVEPQAKSSPNRDQQAWDFCN
jgi:GNAT superfamily N-acetyltransferase